MTVIRPMISATIRKNAWRRDLAARASRLFARLRVIGSPASFLLPQDFRVFGPAAPAAPTALTSK